MSTSSALRLQIESSLERRFPAALSPAPRTSLETAHTGIDQVDQLLNGGLPIGAISEITGPACSGRTSLALAFLAARTQEDRVCAWVDVNDALDSESAAANGVALRQLLWVRCTHSAAGTRLFSHPDYSRLDQALRATDLLLQAGGFSAIVLDLGSTATAPGKRIPLATWFRFRQAADRTRCSLLVLAQQTLAQSSAALVLECMPLNALSAGTTVLRGGSYKVRASRMATRTKTLPISAQRKPPIADWSASASSQREANA